MHRVRNLTPVRSKNGFVPETALLILVASPSLFAANADPGRALPPFYQTTAFYWVCAFAVAAAIALSLRAFRQWRLRAKRKRDDELFALVDQWTKSLRQEVAERKQAQRALQESQEFILRQERLAAVGQLAAGLAHEFNNILTVVQGHAFLLLNKPNLDDESLKSINCINDGVERTARLIKQMLALSRKQIMMRKPLDLRDTLARTGDVFSRILGEQVALNLDIAPHLPTIMADSDMLQQILLNLVVNARDAMPAGGRLTIRADEARFSSTDLSSNSNRKPGRFVRLSVADSGSGMDASIISHLFEPFFTTKEVGKGPGLGLATVQGMVVQHQGWIEVDSKLGHGTRFDVFFPIAADSPEISRPNPDPVEFRHVKETILLVEDQEALRQLVRDVLQNDGFRVLEAPNRLQAVHLWESSPSTVDLALIDASSVNGATAREIASRLWQDNSRLPVVFICDASQEHINCPPDSAHPAACLAKPYSPEQLLQTIRDALTNLVAQRHTGSLPS